MLKNKKYRAVSILAAAFLMVSCIGCTNKADSSSSVTSGASESDSQAVSETSGESQSSQPEGEYSCSKYSSMTPEEITASLTLEQKAAQMVQGAIYSVNNDDMAEQCYGSILSKNDPVTETADDWTKIIDAYQENALRSDAAVPFVYGQDSVHGVNYCIDTVIFPHNINLGAANDKELTYKMGLAVADEIRLTKMIWNFAPCVAVSQDPRWGRTYESYSSDPQIVNDLAGEFTKGLVEGGVIACPKHFFADGNVKYGTGESDAENTRLIDRGDASLSEEEIQKQLDIYRTQIEAGAQSIMISHSSLNGVKMHENAHYITDVLKGEMGFNGVVLSDWESIHNIQGADDLKGQTIIAVNAGIDMLMEPDKFSECQEYIIEGVNEGLIKPERVDDAVTRIIAMKKNAGLFDDPYLRNIKTQQSATGSEEYRDLARKLAEESLVLIKNDNDTLPLKKGTKIFVTGPAADDTGVACGGWTRTWTGVPDSIVGGKLIDKATTILDGLNEIADEYDLTIITDESQADQADITLLCVGEYPYAEWVGDSASINLTEEPGLTENEEAIDAAQKLGKPVVTLIVAGRNVVIDEFKDNWDSIVMCYLFGSEGDCVANVLTGKSSFTGKLAMPWYSSADKIGTDDKWLDIGYGLNYK
ncbi:MAG: glycoside hydrolase family 3 protein [Oscillospiraceae bacterium]|nr:glycoside hydrolase family 3 protein [Oscillospiraceae bacterium]